MVQAYQKHWLAYRQGVRYLDNLFSYFNRVVLAKYRPSTTDPAIPSPQTPQRKLSVDSPIEISQVCSSGRGETTQGSHDMPLPYQGSHDMPKDHMTCPSSYQGSHDMPPSPTKGHMTCPLPLPRVT